MAEASTAKEAVEASFDRPIRILVAAVTRVDERLGEGMDFEVGHQRRIAIAADRGHAWAPGDESGHPSAVASSDVTLTDKCSPMAWAAGQSPARAARARSSTSGLRVPSSANHAAIVAAISSPGTRTVRPSPSRSVT